MWLDSEALVRLIDGPAPRLNAEARAQAGGAAHRIRILGKRAESDSVNSRSLRSILDAHPELIDPAAMGALRKVGILGVDDPYINAFALRDRTAPDGAVVVFEGLLHLIHYFTDLIAVLSQLQTERPDAVIDDGSGGHHPEALLFSMAGFVLLAHFLETGEYPPLLHDLLGSDARRNVKIGFGASVVFLLLHEVAHVTLGHADVGGATSEAAALGGLEGEASLALRQELEADAQAMAWIATSWRGPIQSSLIGLFGAHAFAEAFRGASDRHHPLAVDRLKSLSRAADLTEADREIVDSWIEDRARHFVTMAGDREAAGGSIQANIYKTMSPSHARAIVHEVRTRIQAEYGVLG